MSKKESVCKNCGEPINGKVCANCGTKNGKPIFKKWWFWVIIAVVIIAIVGGSGSDSKNDTSANSTSKETTVQTNEKKQEDIQEDIEYEQYDVTQLFAALDENALRAQNDYKGKYVEITGYLGTVDSSGKYFGLEASPNNYDYMFKSVHCTLKKNSGQLEQIMNINKGDKIVVRGKISDVGEVLGYYLDVDSIN